MNVSSRSEPSAPDYVPCMCSMSKKMSRIRRKKQKKLEIIIKTKKKREERKKKKYKSLR